MPRLSAIETPAALRSSNPPKPMAVTTSAEINATMRAICVADGRSPSSFESDREDASRRPPSGAMPAMPVVGEAPLPSFGSPSDGPT